MELEGQGGLKHAFSRVGGSFNCNALIRDVVILLIIVWGVFDDAKSSRDGLQLVSDYITCHVCDDT